MPMDDFRVFRAEKKKVTSRAELKILQLELGSDSSQQTACNSITNLTLVSVRSIDRPLGVKCAKIFQMHCPWRCH